MTPTQLNPFKRGDTPNFLFEFSAQNEPTYDWSGITVDAAMTAVLAPNDNTGAAITRLNRPVVLQTGGAYFEFIPTIEESKALIPNTKYNLEIQLKQGGTSVFTPITASVKVLQDYVI